jgi:hypothetical protein
MSLKETATFKNGKTEILFLILKTYSQSLFKDTLYKYHLIILNQLQVPTEDSYYFVWENTASISSITGNVNILIQSRAYDLSNYQDKVILRMC